jgi:hypothetical protein
MCASPVFYGVSDDGSLLLFEGDGKVGYGLGLGGGRSLLSLRQFFDALGNVEVEHVERDAPFAALIIIRASAQTFDGGLRERVVIPGR